jgi:hypothetical protein
VEELLNTLKDQWVIMTGFATGVAAWTRTTIGLQHVKEQAMEAKETALREAERVSRIEENLTGIKVDIARVATQQDAIVRELERINNRRA